MNDDREKMIQFPSFGPLGFFREALREKHCGYCKKITSIWSGSANVGMTDAKTGEIMYVCDDCAKDFVNDFSSALSDWGKEIKAEERKKKKVTK